MSITGLNGLTSLGTQYDFTNMTRQQAIAAGGELFSLGKITANECGVLQGFSVDSAPVNGGTNATGYGLNSLVTRNYESLIKQDLQNNEKIGASQQNEITSDKNLLNVLAPYFPSDETATDPTLSTSA